jgi:hypothetical protein
MRRWTINARGRREHLAAQLLVLPGVLLWLDRRSPPVYRRLRNTVVTRR